VDPRILAVRAGGLLLGARHLGSTSSVGVLWTQDIGAGQTAHMPSMKAIGDLTSVLWRRQLRIWVRGVGFEGGNGATAASSTTALW